MSVILLAIAIGIVAGFLAARKGYGTGLCVLLGLFGIIGVIVALVLPRRNKEIKS
jgi:hypothetical protein